MICGLDAQPARVGEGACPVPAVMCHGCRPWLMRAGPGPGPGPGSCSSGLDGICTCPAARSGTAQPGLPRLLLAQWIHRVGGRAYACFPQPEVYVVRLVGGTAQHGTAYISNSSIMCRALPWPLSLCSPLEISRLCISSTKLYSIFFFFI